MPEQDGHAQVKKCIASLGSSFGLSVETEWNPPLFSGSTVDKELVEKYSPRIDVVWLLDMKKELGSSYNNYTHFLEKLIPDLYSPNDFRKVLLAAFEIEYGDTSTKTISSDLFNMALANPLFLFEVIKNPEKGSGGMNTQRAQRIIESCIHFHGHQNYHLVEASRLLEVIGNNQYECKISEQIEKNKKISITGTKMSVEENAFRSVLRDNLEKSGLIPVFEFEPREVFPKTDKKFSMPKIDAVGFLGIRKNVAGILNTLCLLSGNSLYRDLCHVPLLGFETERETGGKHAIGGIINLSRYTRFGFSIAKRVTQSHKLQKAINLYARVFGCNNVFASCYDRL